MCQLRVCSGSSAWASSRRTACGGSSRAAARRPRPCSASSTGWRPSLLGVLLSTEVCSSPAPWRRGCTWSSSPRASGASGCSARRPGSARSSSSRAGALRAPSSLPRLGSRAQLLLRLLRGAGERARRRGLGPRPWMERCRWRIVSGLSRPLGRWRQRWTRRRVVSVPRCRRRTASGLLRPHSRRRQWSRRRRIVSGPRHRHIGGVVAARRSSSASCASSWPSRRSARSRSPRRNATRRGWSGRRATTMARVSKEEEAGGSVEVRRDGALGLRRTQGGGIVDGGLRAAGDRRARVVTAAAPGARWLAVPGPEGRHLGILDMLGPADGVPAPVCHSCRQQRPWALRHGRWLRRAALRTPSLNLPLRFERRR